MGGSPSPFQEVAAELPALISFERRPGSERVIERYEGVLSVVVGLAMLAGGLIVVVQGFGG